MEFSYSASPQPILAATVAAKPIYRDRKPVNIHWDRRVVRGNTHAAAISTLSQLQAHAAAQTAMRTMARAKTLKRPQSKQSKADEASMQSNVAHVAVQTDADLEELVDQTQTKTQATQTDDFGEEDEKPIPVMYVPRARGVDQYTSIEPHELFDFDLAVQPLIEVLIGKCTDQGLTEVQEEEELKTVAARIRRFEQERDLMVAESRRLEQAHLRRHEEKLRRLAQAREMAQKEESTKLKLAARQLAHQYLSGLQENVFQQLEAGGAFYDPAEREVRETFLPWLTSQVSAKLSAAADAQITVDNMIADAISIVVQEKAEILRQQKEAEARELARQREEELRRLEEIERQKRELAEAQRQAEEAQKLLAEQMAAEGAALDDSLADLGEYGQPSDY